MATAKIAGGRRSRWSSGDRRIRVGVSACLLGQRVRHDGRHKRSPLVTGALSRVFEWVPVCPEVELGMGTPREPIHLTRQGAEIRLVGVRTGADHTEAMREYARLRVDALVADGICGFILKKDSPSCGLRRVRIRDERGRVSRSGRGLFAAALKERLPGLPIEEEERLSDPVVLDRWLKRVAAYDRRTRVPRNCKDSGESDSMRSHEAGPGLGSRRGRRR